VTDLEKRAIAALRSVKIPEKLWHAQRAESLNMRLTLQPEATLGLSERADLWFLVWRYRRQIDDLVVIARADQIVNGAMSLAF
jgi:hypothetical protein